MIFYIFENGNHTNTELHPYNALSFCYRRENSVQFLFVIYLYLWCNQMMLSFIYMLSTMCARVCIHYVLLVWFGSVWLSKKKKKKNLIPSSDRQLKLHWHFLFVSEFRGKRKRHLYRVIHGYSFSYEYSKYLKSHMQNDDNKGIE